MFKKTTFLLCIGLLALGISKSAFSDDSEIFTQILQQLKAQTNLQQQIQQYTSQLPGLEQQTINQLMNTAGLDMSTQGFNGNLQSWGNNLSTWQSVLNAYQQGGQGVGGVAQTLNQDFPIQNSNVANPDSNSIDAKYYTLQAQTALASRAASQYDYENIKNQIDYMHQLLKLVPQTKTVKDALDLQNRIQVENSLVQLEILRLSALSNQQQSIESQGEVNAYVNNANAFK